MKTAGGVTNDYDGDGRRVKHANGSGTIFYLWSSVLGQPVAEVTSGGVYRAYAYGPDGGQALAMQSYDGGFYWVHTDHLGSGRKLTNTSGAVAYRGEFDPHGQSLYEWHAGGGSYLNSHKFTGYERDWATNLDDAKARTYHHNRGRFMQPDPLGIAAADSSDPQSLNRYSYVQNDPVNFVDPSGLCIVVARYIANAEIGNGEYRLEFYLCNDAGGGGGGGGGGGAGVIQGGGATSTAEPQQPKKPTKAQCDGIRELLKRERELGTIGASEMSSITFGDKSIQSLNNMHGGIPYGTGELDIDWLMDEYAKIPDIKPRERYYQATPDKRYIWTARAIVGALVYTGGKLINVGSKYADKLISGEGLDVTYPIPFQDAGERLALGFWTRRMPYSAIFNAEWMKANCPE